MNKIESGMLEFIKLREDILSFPVPGNEARQRRNGYLTALHLFENELKRDIKNNRDDKMSFEHLYAFKENCLQKVLENIISIFDNHMIFDDIGQASAWIDIGREIRNIYINLKFGEEGEDGAKRAIQEMEQEPGEDLRSEGNNQRQG